MFDDSVFSEKRKEEGEKNIKSGTSGIECRMLKWIVFDESKFSESVGKDIRNRDYNFASSAKLFAPRALLSLLQDSTLRKTNGVA
jgi:hypothetical protein